MSGVCPDCCEADCNKNSPIGAIRCDVRTIAHLRQKLAASEREVKAWRALAVPIPHYSRPQLEDGRWRVYFGPMGQEIMAHDTPQAAAIDLATKLGLLEKVGG